MEDVTFKRKLNLEIRPNSARILTITGLFFLNIISSIITVWGMLTLYVASYLYQYDQRATPSYMTMWTPVMGLGWSIGAITGVIISQRAGAKASIGIGLASFVGTFVGLSFVTDMTLFLVGFLFCIGFGSSQIFLSSFYLAWEWYPTKGKAMVTAIITFSYSFAGSILNSLFTHLMNPGNLNPTIPVASGAQVEHLYSSEVAGNLALTLRVFGIGIGILSALGMFLISEPIRRYSKTPATSPSSASSLYPSECPSIQAALKTSAFWKLMFLMFTIFSFNYFFVAQFKTYFMTVRNDNSLITSIGSLALILSAVLRIGATAFSDALTFKQTATGVAILQAAITLTIPLIVHFPWVYGLWITLALSCSVVAFYPVATVCKEIYGEIIGSKCFSLLQQNNLIGTLALIPLTEYILLPIGYDMVFAVLTGLSLVSAVLMLTMKTERYWVDEKKVHLLECYV